MSDFRKMVAWRAAHRLALRIYEITMELPPRELFGLSAQLRRAAVSIGSNLAEGSGRGSDAELRRFALIARGSAMEVISQLLVSRDLGLLAGRTADAAIADAEHVCRILSGLVRSLQKRVAGPKPNHPG